MVDIVDTSGTVLVSDTDGYASYTGRKTFIPRMEEDQIKAIAAKRTPFMYRVSFVTGTQVLVSAQTPPMVMSLELDTSGISGPTDPYVANSITIE